MIEGVLLRLLKINLNDPIQLIELSYFKEGVPLEKINKNQYFVYNHVIFILLRLNLKELVSH